MPEPRPVLNAPTIAAVTLGAIALAASVVSYLSIVRAHRLVGEVAEQSEIAAVYEARAVHCLDETMAALSVPGEDARAERSLNISNGITLCLVHARENARLDLAALEDCVRQVEAANMLDGIKGEVLTGPAC